jgi:hypothetical protein
LGKGETEVLSLSKVSLTQHRGERSQAYSIWTLVSQTVSEPLSVDLVDILVLVPCFDDCPVEAVKEFLQGLPRSAYKHRERLICIGGGRTTAYRADPPDCDLATGFYQGVDILEARGPVPSIHVSGAKPTCHGDLYGISANSIWCGCVMRLDRPCSDAQSRIRAYFDANTQT